MGGVCKRRIGLFFLSFSSFDSDPIRRDGRGWGGGGFLFLLVLVLVPVLVLVLIPCFR